MTAKISSKEFHLNNGYRIALWMISAFQSIIGGLQLLRHYFLQYDLYYSILLAISLVILILLFTLPSSRIRDVAIDITLYECIIHAICAYGTNINSGPISYFTENFSREVLLPMYFIFLFALLWPRKDKNRIAYDWQPIGLFGFFKSYPNKLDKRNVVYTTILTMAIFPLCFFYIEALWGLVTVFTLLVGIATFLKYSNYLNNLFAETLESNAELQQAIAFLNSQIEQIKQECIVYISETETDEFPITTDIVFAMITPEQEKTLTAMENLMPGYKQGLIAEILNLAGKDWITKPKKLAENDFYFNMDRNPK
jgi:hypothetical protein